MVALATLGGLLAVTTPGNAQTIIIDPGPNPPTTDVLEDLGDQNDAQRDMGNSIGNVCPTLAANQQQLQGDALDLQQVCTAMVQTPGGGPESFGLTDDETNAALQRINGEEVLTVQSEIGEIQAGQVGNISARIAAIRAGFAGPGISLAGLNAETLDPVIAGARGLTIVPAQWEDSALSRLGLFLTGGFQFGNKDASDQVDGFDFDTIGVTAGADYRLSDTFVIGAAFGYNNFDADFDGGDGTTDSSVSGQELDNNSYLLSLFASYFPTDQLFVDGVATFGYSGYDSTRRIVIPNNNAGNVFGGDDIDRTAEGDFDAIHLGFAGNVGYDIPFGALTVTPIGRLAYTRAEVDGFSEEGAAGLNLTYDDQDVSSLTTNLGVEARYALSTGFGVLVPTARAEFVHEFLNDPDGVRITYLSDPTTTQLSSFTATTEDVDRNYGVLGAGLIGQFAGGWSAFVDYSTVVALDLFDIHSINVGLRKSF